MESLYTKYRPQTFADVVGQGHVVATLERAVLEGRTGHAYLFCGPRGTGKTTMARLLAKALLCEQGPGHLPDGTCEQCRLVAVGEHPDVYELDAASNTGVDNVREEIISRVDYAPVMGSRKIYIIDEVHMLTTAAFNALLKTLEEPPSHVVFILCTTDPQKILETILSRVQRFDFHAISNEDVLARIRYVCEQEGYVYEPQALDLIVRQAQGGMRDALTKLEQLATGGGGSISLEAAQELLGEVPSTRLAGVSMALAQRDVKELFAAVGEFADAGRDLLQVTVELSARLRDVYVLAAVGNRPGIVSATGAELEQLTAEAAAWISPDRLARALAILAETSSEMRLATNQRLTLELAFTRLARPEGDLTLDALADRVAVLERRILDLEARPVAQAALTREEEATRKEQASVGSQPAETAGAPVPPSSAGSSPVQASAASAGPAEASASPDVPRPTAASGAAPASATTPTSPVASPHTSTPRQQVPAEGGPAPAPASPVVASQASTPRQQMPAEGGPASAPASAAAPGEARGRTTTVGAGNAASARPATPAPMASAPSAVPTQAAPAQGTAQPAQPAASAVTDPGELQRRWKQVCDDLLKKAPPRGSLLMQSTIISDDGTTLLINLPKGSGFAVRMLDRADVRALIDPLVAQRFGRRRLVFAESSLVGADIARGERAAARPQVPQTQVPQTQQYHPAPAPAPVPAPSPAAPATPAPQQQPASSTATPAGASATNALFPAQPATEAPHAAPAQPAPEAPHPAPAQPAPPAYPLPWESAAPDDDQVPYDDIDVYGEYDEEDAPIGDVPLAATFAPAGAPGPSTQASATAQQHAPEGRATETTARPSQEGALLPAEEEKRPVDEGSRSPEAVAPAAVPEPEPAAPKPASAPSPAPTASAPAPKPAPAPAPAPKPAPVPAPTPDSPAPKPAPTPAQSSEEAELMALLTDVFGEGVTRKD